MNLADTNALLADLGAEPMQFEPEKKRLTDPSNHYSPGPTSSIEEKVINLLGAGVSAEHCAAAVGVSPSRISQMISDPNIANKVAALKYEHLQAHNKRDDKYNSIEDTLLDKLDRAMPLMIKPDQILKAIQVVNGAKRRGQNSPDTGNTVNNVVQVVLPTVIASKFITNGNNQVTRVGEQELLTMASSNLLQKVEAAQLAQNEIKELPNDKERSI